MASLPPLGERPAQPLSATQPERGAGAALAGFLCGLASFAALLLAMLLAGEPELGPLARILPRLHDALVPGTTSGEGMLLFTAAVPVAVVGLVLSFRGRHAHSRRWLAIVGMVLSFAIIVCYGVELEILREGWSQVFRYGMLPGSLGWA